jgi:hypothetical protein
MTPEQANNLANTINGIVCAGLHDMENPLFMIYDPAGNLTALNPAALSPNDIIVMVAEWYGEDVAQRAAQLPQLTIH